MKNGSYEFLLQKTCSDMFDVYRRDQRDGEDILASYRRRAQIQSQVRRTFVNGQVATRKHSTPR